MKDRSAECTWYGVVFLNGAILSLVSASAARDPTKCAAGLGAARWRNHWRRRGHRLTPSYSLHERRPGCSLRYNYPPRTL